jgi:hypothetical protein
VSATERQLGYFILDANKNVVYSTMDEWVAWRVKHPGDKNVFSNEINGYWISTVFLGMDIGFGTPPLYFETMVFKKVGNDIDFSGRIYEDRYETYEQAKEGHAYACRYVKCLVLL